jgi:glycosyltransferase involved in cell wall biosynthesis
MKPKVSVLVPTYNQAAFIAQTIEGVLQQKTSFPFELVLGDDASTDHTPEIIGQYQRQAPDIVRHLRHEKNLGVVRNTACTLAACRGDYIAVVEGDDYWTAADKLQIQADLLDAHPETAICGHQTVFLYEGTDRDSIVFPDQETGFYPLEELLRWNFLPSPTVMFRGGLIPQLPEWYFDAFVPDWPLYLLLARRGNIAFLKQSMSVYRVHPKSLWSSRGEIFRLQEKLKFFAHLYDDFDPQYHPAIRATMFDFTYWLGREYVAAGDLAEARRCFRRCLPLAPPAAHLKLKTILAVQAYTPRLFQLLRVARRLLAPGRPQ